METKDITTPNEIDFNPLALRDAIQEMGITQSEFADRAGFYHRNYVTRLIDGSKRADVKDLVRLCLVTGKPMEYFLSGALVNG